MQLNTYRFRSHHVGDINRDCYRSKEEEAFWKAERDPIRLFGRWLAAEKIVTEDQLQAVNAEVRAETDAAVAYAMAAPYPDLSEVGKHVFVDKAA